MKINPFIVALAAFLIGTSQGIAQINTGTNTLGSSSSAIGDLNAVTGTWSLANGATNTITSNYSFVSGRANNVSGLLSSAFGINNNISGPFSYAFGQNNTASSSNSFAFGNNTRASGVNSFVFGYDPNTSTPFTNSRPNSFLVGFSFKSPGFMVTHSPNSGPLVGVATDNPLDRLDIRLGDKQEIRIQSEVPNTYSGISFKHSDGSENWRLRSYSNYLGGYGNTLGLIGTGGGNFWIAADKTLIGDFFNFDYCLDCDDFNLFVKKGIRAERVKVDVASGIWADYVFAQGYELKTLTEVEAFIEENKHLPGIPSAQCIQEEGLDVAKTDALLLEKIEELTLYMIAMEKQLKEQRLLIQGLQNDQSN